MPLGLQNAYGVGALDELVAERKKEQLLKEAIQRQVQQQQFANSMQEQQLSLRNRQLDQQTQDRQAAQSSLDTNRQFAQGANISEHSMPGDVFDQPTADLLRKVGQGGMIRTTAAQPAGHLTNADDQGPVDAVPEQNISRGGSGYLRAKMAQDEINARSAASLAETAGRNKALQSESDARLAETSRHNREMETVSRGSQGEAPTLTPEGLDKAAELWNASGIMVPMGMGKAGAKVRSDIINRAAQLHPGESVAGNKAEFGSDSASLRNLQQMSDALGAYEGTAEKNIGVMQEVLKSLPDAGAAIINAPLRDAARALGNESVAKFDAIRTSLAAEYARIVSNPRLVGVLTDQARKEIERGIAPGATAGQIMSALNTYRQEATNRKAATRAQLDTVRGRLNTRKMPEENGHAPVEGTRSKYRGSITVE